MASMAVLIVTTMAVVTSASAAHLPRAEPVRVTSQDAAEKFKEVNETCVLEENCTLHCSFEGQIEKVLWYNGKELIPIAFYPETLGLYQRHDFRENVSLSVNQSAGDASLQLRGVKTQHQGTYSCSPTTSRGTRDTLIQLKVHIPVGEVQLQQNGQKLICRAEGIYPQPNVTWAPAAEANTTVIPTARGLYNVLSSVVLPESPAEEYNCSVSTPHSSGTAAIKPQHDPAPDKSYLWILVVPVVLLIAVVVLIICCCKKRCKGDTPSPTSGNEEQEGTRTPLNPPVPNQESHQNGLNHVLLEVTPASTSHAANGQLNGHEAVTSV